jgi:hypothetical protein
MTNDIYQILVSSSILPSQYDDGINLLSRGLTRGKSPTAALRLSRLGDNQYSWESRRRAACRYSSRFCATG